CRMTRQPRTQNALHLLMLLQPARDFHRVLAALAHAQRQRLESPQREKAVKRTTDGTDRVLQERHALRERRILDDDDTTNHGGVTVEELGRRVHHDVAAELERALN